MADPKLPWWKLEWAARNATMAMRALSDALEPLLICRFCGQRAPSLDVLVIHERVQHR